MITPNLGTEPHMDDQANHQNNAEQMTESTSGRLIEKQEQYHFNALDAHQANQTTILPSIQSFSVKSLLNLTLS